MTFLDLSRSDRLRCGPAQGKAPQARILAPCTRFGEKPRQINVIRVFRPDRHGSSTAPHERLQSVNQIK
jgi:hypothetical protein